MDVLKPILLYYYITDSVERMIIAFTDNSGGSHCALVSEQVLNVHSIHFSFIFIDLLTVVIRKRLYRNPGVDLDP